MRVIFDGSNGKGGSPYDIGTFYSATAGPSGTGWKLATGSLSHTDFPPLTDDAAAVLPNGVPVTAWSSGPALSYHVGIDPSVPAKAPDIQIPAVPGGGVIDPTLVTDEPPPDDSYVGEYREANGLGLLGVSAPGRL